MKKLQVAIGISGTLVFLETFPHDEEHYGLHEMLREIETDADFEEKPGLYLATLEMVHEQNDWTGDYNSYLDITKLDLIREYEQPPTPEEIEEQERLKAEILKERQAAASADPTITLGDGDFDSKDIYLETFIGPGKIRQVVGLHAVGHAGPYEYDLVDLDQSRTRIKTNFMAIEVWGNEYDSIDGKMIGRGSFRIHNSDLDREVKQWEAEGWTRCERPGKKDEVQTKK